MFESSSGIRIFENFFPKSGSNAQLVRDKVVHLQHKLR